MIVMYVFTHVLKSIVMGCLTSLSLLIIGLFVFLLVKSTKEPVNVFNYYIIDNFEISRIKK
jgi:hypothetical protein